MKKLKRRRTKETLKTVRINHISSEKARAGGYKHLKYKPKLIKNGKRTKKIERMKKTKNKKRHCKCGNLLITMKEITEEKCEKCILFKK